MTDLYALLAFLLVLALVLAIWSGDVVGWLIAEWRRMRLNTWADEMQHEPFSVSDPRVARMDLKRRALGKRLRKQGKTLLAGKPYVPALTKPTTEASPPPKAEKVVSINARRKVS